MKKGDRVKWRSGGDAFGTVIDGPDEFGLYVIRTDPTDGIPESSNTIAQTIATIEVSV